MRKPLAIDIFCGLGGWTEGLLAEGWNVVGFDIERHVYGEHRYPSQLVLQDVLTIHGRQFKDADLIVASPPCQAYSYRAMPWKRAKALPPPDNSLFEACFRIQREASDAAGRHIPLVVENVRGAQRWVGRARWHFGSFYLWGDVPALMPLAKVTAKRPGHSMNKGAPQWGPHHNTTEIIEEGIKNPGFRFDGSGKSFQSESVKVSGLDFSGYGKPGYKAQAFNTTAEQRLREEGLKMPSGDSTRTDKGRSAALGNYDRLREGIKQGDDWFNKASGNSISRRCSSRSKARKHASAMIAKIPLVLSRHIARIYYPS